MKRITFWKSLFLLCALIVGSTSAWAKTQSWDLTTAKYSSASASKVTWSGINVTFTSDQNGGTAVNTYLGGTGTNSHTRFYTNNILTFTPLNGASISKIELTIVSSSGGPSYISTNAGELTNCTSTYSSPKVTITPTTGTTACSVKVGGSSKNTRVESVVVTYTGGSDVEEASADFTYSPAFMSIGVNYTNTLNTTPDGLTVTYSSGNGDIATVDASTGEVTGKKEGIVEITATWEQQTVGSKTYAAGSKKYELYVGKVIEDGKFDFTGYQNYGSGVILSTNTSAYQGKDAYVFTAGNITLTTGGDNSKYFSWYDVTDDKNELRFYSGTNYTLAAPAGYVITQVDFTGKSNVEKMTVNTGSLTGNNTTSTWTGCAKSVTFTRGNGNPGYYTITVTYVSSFTAATVSDAGWATYVTPVSVEFDENTAFVVTSAGNKITAENITKVRANTAILLKGAGAKTATVLSTDPVAPTTNLLAISDGTNGVNDYVLYKDADHAVGFYKWTGAALAKGKVYLPASAVTGARTFIGFDENVANGIDNVVVDTINNNAPMYNLAGQRVNKSYKGVVIVNGKKMLNK